jgi:protein involved in polysaccharide export with SLBB domain
LQEILPGRDLSMPTALGADMLTPRSIKPAFDVRTRIRRAFAAMLLLALWGRPAAAQGYEAMQPMATRSELSALADRLSRGSESDRNKASALRTRLRDGDFRAGDRIRLVIEGNVTQDDTVSVIAGSKVLLKEIGEIPLAGVLRSELQDHVTKQLSRYIKDVRVRVTPLVRLSVLGPVARPGFFYVPSDIPASEAIMRAGGPTGSADLNKSVIRRGTAELYDSRNTRTALNEGLTLDQLSLRDGDSIEVGEKSTGGWAKIASIIGVVTSLAWAIAYVGRR